MGILSSKNLFNPNYYLNQTYLTGIYKYTLSDVVGNRTLYFKAKLKEGKERINGLFVSLTTSGGNPNEGTSCYAIRGGNPSASQYISADFTGTNNLYLSFYPATYRWEQINEVYDFWIATEDIEYSPYIDVDTEIVNKISDINEFLRVNL